MPGPTTPTPAEMPYTSFSATEDRVRLKLLREALRMANVPDATADQVLQRQRQTTAYVGRLVLQSIRGTTTTFIVYGAVIKDLRVIDYTDVGFSFPPNDPKYLAEFVRALNYPHLMVSIYIQNIDVGLTPTDAVIDWMEVLPAWELTGNQFSFVRPPWNEVKIDPWFNKVKIVT